MRPCGLQQAMRRALAATGESARSLSRARSCSALSLKAVVLTLCILVVVGGCATDTSPTTSPVPSPAPGSVAEATRPPTWTAWPNPTEEYPSVAQRPPPHSVAEATRWPTWTAWPNLTEEYPSVAQLKAWRNAVGEGPPDNFAVSSGPAWTRETSASKSACRCCAEYARSGRPP